jgi:hypothetical protein
MARTPMRRHDKAGRVCHWILEIHLTDTERQFGGFHEQLLDLGQARGGLTTPSTGTRS